MMLWTYWHVSMFYPLKKMYSCVLNKKMLVDSKNESTRSSNYCHHSLADFRMSLYVL